MANHSLPTITSTYSDFVTQLDARFDDLSLGLDPAFTTASNLPVNSIRWASGSNKWQKWNGTSWLDLAGSYSININGSVGASAPSTGAFTTITTSGAASLGAGSTIAESPIATTTGAQTLTNKTLTSPVISTIVNTGTLTLPTTTDTIVGRSTTDTLTNKTLTAPRFADGGFIADPSGARLLEFDQVASAVNYLQLGNAATNSAVNLSALGTDVNVSINIVPKGTGTLRVGGIDVATTTGIQTLTNKTLTSPAISTIVNTGTLTLPTTTDTIVGRSTTDTLTNKTLTAPKFADGGFIADPSGARVLEFDQAASAVNYLGVVNSATTVGPTVQSMGTDANINLNLVAKGTGVVTADGVEVVTTTGTQTLSNKTWNGVAIAEAFGGTGATTYAAARANLNVPTRTGGDASGTWSIAITGNAATVTNGVYTTGAQSIGGAKAFTGSLSQSAVAIPSLDIDCSAGNYFTKTISTNSTFTVSNIPTGTVYSFTLELTHTSGSVTWFSGVQWPNAAAPSLTTGRVHLFMFITDDGGATWRGASLTNYTA